MSQMFSKWKRSLNKVFNSLDSKIHQIVKKPKNVSEMIARADKAITSFDHEIYDIFFADVRNRDLSTVSSLPENNTYITKHTDYTDTRLKIALIAFGAAFVGLYLPISNVISISLMLFYITETIEASLKFLKKGKIKKEMINVVLFFGCIATGQMLSLSIGMVIFLLAEKFSARLQDQSQKRLVNVFQVPVKNIWIQINDQEIQIPFEKVKIGDIVVAQAGEVIPVDGIIVDGIGTIDQHTITGESEPIERCKEDQVFASTLLLMGKIYIQTSKTGNEIAAYKIQQTLLGTTSYIANVQSKADQQADQTAPFLIGATIASSPFLRASALSLLYLPISFNMRFLGPLGMLNFLNMASSNNILIKDGRCLEELSQIDTVIFDKTGTLTFGKPTVSKIIALENYTQEEILRYAATAEKKLSHPIAKAILKAAEKQGIQTLEIENSSYEIGYGVQICIEAKTLLVGSLRFMKMQNVDIKKLSGIKIAEGSSHVFVALESRIIGVLEIGSTIRPEAYQVVQDLRNRGLKLYILSGDHEKATQSIASELGINNYYAEVLPQGKAKIVEELQKQGNKICFVGDGINDAIALQKANISVSLLGATSLATDCAQIVFMDKNIRKLDQLFELATHFSKNQSVSRQITNVATCLSLGTIVFFKVGILTTMIIAEASFLMGTVNTMKPWISFKNQNQKKIKQDSYNAELQ